MCCTMCWCMFAYFQITCQVMFCASTMCKDAYRLFDMFCTETISISAFVAHFAHFAHFCSSHNSYNSSIHSVRYVGSVSVQGIPRLKRANARGLCGTVG
jgi:uncharacterized protein YdcH (DUF465 family)